MLKQLLKEYYQKSNELRNPERFFKKYNLSYTPSMLHSRKTDLTIEIRALKQKIVQIAITLHKKIPTLYNTTLYNTNKTLVNKEVEIKLKTRYKNFQKRHRWIEEINESLELGKLSTTVYHKE